MSCTKYDDPISYNAPIPYNGICVTPPVPTRFQAGGYAYPPPRKKKKKENEEDEVIAMILAELMEDD